MNNKFFRAYVVPICVYQSVYIAGGYGTGREVIEFFTRYGVYGGLYGLVSAGLLLAIVTALTFELARLLQAYDYRSFLKELIGPFWVGFEIMYLGIFLIVLAVVGSATGSILNEHLGIPEFIGPVIIFAVITTLAFYGRSLVEKVMVFLTVFLYAAFIFYFISALSANSDQIAHQFSSTTDYWPKGWLVPGLQFAVYSSPAAILIIFATHGITTRTEAFVSGTLCGLLVMIPGFLFHISFLGVLPEVLQQPVPVHWIINKLDVPLLLPIYLVALIGTFIGSGTGFIQAVNERLDHWSMERTGSVYPAWIHSSVAIVGLMISAALAQFGIITLIAKGYGNAAWGFLVLFVIPVLTVGAYKIFLRRKSPDAPSS